MRNRIISLALLCLLVAAQSVCAGDIFQREIRKTFDISNIEMLRIDNLAGRVLVEGTDGDRIVVTAIVNSDKFEGLEADEVSELLELDISEKGDRLLIRAKYPLDDYRSYRFKPGKGGFFGGSSRFRVDGRKVKIYSGRKGKGLVLWVDFRVALPSGVRFDLRNRVGQIKMEDVHAESRIDCASADVHVERQVGDLMVDSGSGNITVKGCSGYLKLDSGSGDLKLADLRGDFHADTGSGDVTLRKASGEELHADTGSGDVTLRDIDYPRLRVDTGSGDVLIESPSGLVDRWIVDTGSGDVEFLVGRGASFRLDVDTGSGDVDCDFDAAKLRMSRGEIRSITVGDGDGDIEVDTGSGDVSIRKM